MATYRSIAFAIISCWCVSAVATTTGNELAYRCDQSAAYCIGYISGVIDAETDPLGFGRRIQFGQPTTEEFKLIELNRQLTRKQLQNIHQLQPFQVRLLGRFLAEHGLDPKEPGSNRPWHLKACLPNSATRPQLVDVVSKFLRDNPAERHNEAQGLVVRALATAFPCD